MSILQDRNKGLDFKEQLSTGTRAKERRKLLGTITELRNTFELAFSWEWDYHTCFTDEDSNAQSRAQLFLQLCHWTWDLHADGLELAISASSCPIQGQDPFGCRWGGLRVGFAGEHSYAQCRHGIMTFALDILSLKSEWLVHLQNEAQMSLPVWSTSLGAECLLPCFVPIWARYLSLLWFTFRNNKLPLKAMSASPDWEPSRRAFLFLHLWQLVKAREVFMNRVNQLINHLWFVHSAYFFFFYRVWDAVGFRKRGNNSIARCCNPARETNVSWQTTRPSQNTYHRWANRAPVLGVFAEISYKLSLCWKATEVAQTPNCLT